MNKTDFATAIAMRLRENEIGKVVQSPKHVFHISDDEGNKKDFVVKKSDKTVYLTGKDVYAVLDAACDVLMDILKNGDTLTIQGIGAIGLKYRKPRRVKDNFNSENWIELSGRYIPSFTFGKDLRVAAKLYELSLIDEDITEDPPMVDNEDGE